MESFVPKRLTKRMVTSKFMGIFDIKGLIIPLTARFKRDLRRIVIDTPGWDTPISCEHRTVWVRNFLTGRKSKV